MFPISRNCGGGGSIEEAARLFELSPRAQAVNGGPKQHVWLLTLGLREISSPIKVA
jgi:hypothetical protein